MCDIIIRKQTNKLIAGLLAKQGKKLTREELILATSNRTFK